MRPVILIPGFGGSILAPRTGAGTPNNHWIQLSLKKWNRDMHLELKRHPDNSQIIGIHPNHIDAYNVGSVRGVIDIIPRIPFITDYYDTRYFAQLCEHLETAGYKDQENMYGMSYDFRRILDPEYRTEWFAALRACIEEAQRKNGLPPLIIAHSLGAVVYKWFLECQTHDWARREIFHSILVCAGFAGCSYALRAVVSGDHYIPALSHKTRDVLAQNSGIVMCLPNFSSDNYMIVDGKRIDGRTYKEKLGISGEIYTNLYRPHLSKIFVQRPDLSVDLIQTLEHQTPLAFISNNGDFPHKTVYTTGDGIITERGLLVAARLFPNAMIYNIEGSTHTKILSNPQFIQKVFEALYFGPYSKWPM